MSQGRREVAQLRSRLDGAFARIASIGPDEIETRADFSRYLCVLVCGYLENAVIALLSEHCRQKASPRVQAYALSHIQRLQNPSREKILDMVGRFDSTWKRSLELYIVDEKKDAIGSVLKERHKIAHGENSSISYVRISNYLAAIEDVVMQIANLVDPP